jgi:hypothetical protein
MIVVEVKGLEKYQSEIGLSFDFVISNTKEIIDDGFDNPCVYDFDEVV